jgi:hypothetical protein
MHPTTFLKPPDKSFEKQVYMKSGSTVELNLLSISKIEIRNYGTKPITGMAFRTKPIQYWSAPDQYARRNE